MDEFWVCQHCKSLNRSGTNKCYSCKKSIGSKPATVGTFNRNAAPTPLAPPPPPPGGPIPVDFGARNAPPAYLSRPAAPTAPAPYLTGPAEGYGGLQDQPYAVPHPVSGIKRTASAWLARHPSVQIAWLGYITAGLLIVTVLLGAMLVLALLPVATYALQWSDLGGAWGQLSASQHGNVQSLATFLAVVGSLTLLCLSVFTGLSAHNATGLGTQPPLLSPYRAGTAWWGAIWAQLRIVVGLAVPPTLIWKGYTIPGLIAAIVAIEIAQRHMDSGDAWMARPAKGLPDLYDKLSSDETPTRSPIAAFWSVCFRISNILVIALAVIPWIALAGSEGLTIAGHSEVSLWKSGGLGLEQIVIALVAGLMAGWAFASTAMLVPLMLGLVQRQRTRRTLARVGRSRSWVARPGGGGYAPYSPHPDGDPEDRIIERSPLTAGDFATGGFEAALANRGQGFGGGPGFVARPGPILDGTSGQLTPGFDTSSMQLPPGFGSRPLPQNPDYGVPPPPPPPMSPNSGFGPGYGGPGGTLPPSFGGPGYGGPGGTLPPSFGAPPPPPQFNPGGQRLANSAGPIGGRMVTIGGSGSGGILGNRPVPPGSGPGAPQPGFPGYDNASFDSGRIVERRPNQASLNSPSTTSSPPWSGEPSDEPPG